MKKLISLLLVLVVVFSISLFTFADIAPPNSVNGISFLVQDVSIKDGKVSVTGMLYNNSLTDIKGVQIVLIAVNDVDKNIIIGTQTYDTSKVLGDLNLSPGEGAKCMFSTKTTATSISNYEVSYNFKYTYENKYDAHSEIYVFYNNERVVFSDVTPVIADGRTLVPLRGVLEKIGATVEWDEDTNTITCKKDGTIIELKVGSKIAQVNGVEVTLDVPAQLVNDRTMIPLRFFSSYLGLTIGWGGNINSVVLYSSDFDPE